MKSKYSSRKVTIDGIEFDSVKEGNRYRELKLLERAGKIRNLRCQVPYVLIPAQYEFETVARGAGEKLVKRKCIERECTYVADFVYLKVTESPTVTMPNGNSYSAETVTQVVEDVKGYRGSSGAYAVFTIKRKLMLERHGIRVQEV